jgi:hypothetical protein
LSTTLLSRNDVYEHYSVAKDGRRFLIVRPAEQAAPQPITVVLNWPQSS